MTTMPGALGQTHRIVSATEQPLERALEQARRLTQDGQDIDAYQVHCERLAYRATELQAGGADRKFTAVPTWMNCDKTSAA